MPSVWMPMYWGDLLADTTHLSTAEFGAYCLLIAAYWQGRQPLPDDDDRLARIVKLDAKAWKGMRRSLSRFFDVGDGLWQHGRIEEELAKASEISQKRQRAGKRSASVRASVEQTSNHPHPPLPKKVDTDDGLPEWVEREAWESWVQYRRERRQSLTPSTIRRQLAFLAQHRDHHAEIIDRSITNGWQGLFPLSGGSHAQAGKPVGAPARIRAAIAARDGKG